MRLHSGHCVNPACTSYQAGQYATALIHLDSAAALPVLERYRQRFKQYGQFEWLRGYALWRLGDPEGAYAGFAAALAQAENSSNLLAAAHFHLEQGDLPQARSFADRALEQVRRHDREEEAICRLSQAVVLWQQGEPSAAHEKLRPAEQRQRRITRSNDRQYANFWGSQTIAALQALPTASAEEPADR